MKAQKIAVLTDSCADVPAEFAEKHGIYVVPQKIVYKRGEYSDGVDITAQQVYEGLSTEIPKTSLPGGGEILDLLKRIQDDGNEKVLVVTISSGLSGTFNLMRMISDQYDGMELFVVDSRNIGIGSGFIAMQAAEYISQGMCWEELKEKIAQSVCKSKIYFCIPTLEYLVKGGRIGLVTAIAGSILNLKPIISCNEDGIYYTAAKVRGWEQAWQRAVDLAVKFAETGKRYNIALVHGNAKEEAEKIKKKLMPLLPHCQLFTEGQISPALGVHTGPGLIGIAVLILESITSPATA